MTMQENQAPQRVKVEMVDRPEMSETFADSLQLTFFDGQTLRLNFCVTRVEEPGSTAKRYPACRLVLSTSAAIELINQMQKVADNLVQAGVLRRDAARTPPEKAN